MACQVAAGRELYLVPVHKGPHAVVEVASQRIAEVAEVAEAAEGTCPPVAAGTARWGLDGTWAAVVADQ